MIDRRRRARVLRRLLVRTIAAAACVAAFACATREAQVGGPETRDRAVVAERAAAADPPRPDAPTPRGLEWRLVEVVFEDGRPLAGATEVLAVLTPQDVTAFDGPLDWSTLDARGRGWVAAPTDRPFRLEGEDDAAGWPYGVEFLTDASVEVDGVARCVVAARPTFVKVVDEDGGPCVGVLLDAVGVPTREDVASVVVATDADGVARLDHWTGDALQVSLAGFGDLASAGGCAFDAFGGEKGYFIVAASGAVGPARHYRESGVMGARWWMDGAAQLRPSAYDVRPGGAATFVVRRHARVRGRVLDVDGRPAADVDVFGTLAFPSATADLWFGRTDAEGRFEAPLRRDGLSSPTEFAAARLTVTSTIPGEAAAQLSVGSASITAPGDVDFGDLRAADGFFRLEVMNSDGTPAQGVTAANVEARWPASLDGVREFGALPEGTPFRVSARGGAPVVVAAPRVDPSAPPPTVVVRLPAPPKLTVRLPEGVVSCRLVGDVEGHDFDPADGASIRLEHAPGVPLTFGARDVRVLVKRERIRDDGARVAEGVEIPVVAGFVALGPAGIGAEREITYPVAEPKFVVEVTVRTADGEPATGVPCRFVQNAMSAEVESGLGGRAVCAVGDGVVRVVASRGLAAAVVTIDPARSPQADVRLPPIRDVRVDLPAGRWIALADGRREDVLVTHQGEAIVRSAADATVRFVSDVVQEGEAPAPKEVPGARPFGPPPGFLVATTPPHPAFAHVRIAVEGDVRADFTYRRRPTFAPFRAAPMTLPPGRYRVTAHLVESADYLDHGRTCGAPQWVEIRAGETSEVEF